MTSNESTISLTYKTAKTSFPIFLKIGFQALTLLIIAKLVGPVLFGYFAALTGVCALLSTLAPLGTHFNYLKVGKLTESPLDKEFVNTVSITLFFGLTLTSIFYLSFLPLLHDSQISSIFIISIGLKEIVISSLYKPVAFRLLKKEKPTSAQIVLMCPSVARFLASVSLFHSPYDILTTYGILSVVYSITTLYIVFYGVLKTGDSIRNLVTKPSLGYIKQSLIFAPTNFVRASANEIDKMYALVIFGPNFAGIYSAASKAASSVSAPSHALSFVTINRLFANKKSDGLQFLKVTYITSILIGLIGFALVYLMSFYIEPVLGKSYAGTGHTMKLLAIAIPASTIKITSGTALTANDRPHIRSIIEFSGIALLGGLAYALSSLLTNNAMPIAFLATEYILAAILTISLFSHFRKRN